VSVKNADFLRDVYAEWSKGNFAAGTQAYDENVLLVVRPDFADPGVFTGVDAVRSYMRSFLEPWKTLTIEGTGFREVGDSVLVRVVQRGVGRSSGAQGDLSYHQLWTLRGGKVIRIDVILDEQEALEAVGL
jgi:ketosteroid isomerase-like protein